MINLSGKTYWVAGVANKDSIAWQCAKVIAGAGGRVCITYQDEKLRAKIEKLIAALDDLDDLHLNRDETFLLQPCDVTSNEQLGAAINVMADWAGGILDGLVHCIGFAPLDTFKLPYVRTTQADFEKTMMISAYSLLTMVSNALPILAPAQDTSIVALTHMASERATPFYNVMGTAKAALEHIVRQLAWELGPQGIRVNSISAGPTRTLASFAIPGFNQMADHHRKYAPLRKDTKAVDSANAVAFLLSELASNITGTNLYVDGGYHSSNIVPQG